MEPVDLPIADIYVPVRLRNAVDPAKVAEIAESMMADDRQLPIHVRRDKDRFVLVTGVHRLEAARALGEPTIQALIVQARRA